MSVFSIDYALAFDFVEPTDTSTPYRLEFRYRYQQPQPGQRPQTNPRGQLFAVVKGRHPRRGDSVPMSRADVHLDLVDAAVDRDHLPWHSATEIDLTAIRAHIHAAGLA